MPDCFALPYHGAPTADLRVWHRLFGNRSPRQRHGVGHMLEALITYDRDVARGRPGLTP